MIIDRPSYMERLIRQMGASQVKVITGIRRCGKSFLLFNLFKAYLLDSGVPESNIIEMAFDRYSNRKYRDAYELYSVYGGMPGALLEETPEEKATYLCSLFDELYLNDIIERGGVRDRSNLEELIDVLSSSIGSLTNPSKLSATFKSEKHVSISFETIARYIELLEDSFLVSHAKRYDVKGRRYIGTPFKYYFTDLGLRNARMNFRQVEPTHIMENLIYNELACRGFSIDVGAVPINVRDESGTSRHVQLEVDFVCNKGSRRYYVQSAFALPTQDKCDQESRPLLKVDDSFKKIIVTKEGPAPYYSEDGILHMNVFDFLLDPDSLDK